MFYCRPKLLIHSFFSHFTCKAVIFTPAYVRLIIDYSQSLYFFHAGHGKSEKEGEGRGGWRSERSDPNENFSRFPPPTRQAFCFALASSPLASLVRQCTTEFCSLNYTSIFRNLFLILFLFFVLVLSVSLTMPLNVPELSMRMLCPFFPARRACG